MNKRRKYFAHRTILKTAIFTFDCENSGFFTKIDRLYEIYLYIPKMIFPVDNEHRAVAATLSFGVCSCKVADDIVFHCPFARNVYYCFSKTIVHVESRSTYKAIGVLKVYI